MNLYEEAVCNAKLLEMPPKKFAFWLIIIIYFF